MHLEWLAVVGETLPKDKTNHSILHLKQPLLASTPRVGAQMSTNHSRLHLKQLLPTSTPLVGAQDCKQSGDVSTEHRVQKHEFNSREATPVIIGMPSANKLFIDKGLAGRCLPSRNDVMAVPEMGIFRWEICIPHSARVAPIQLNLLGSWGRIVRLSNTSVAML